MMYVYNLPFRGISRMTMGAINMKMVDGILMAVNGKFLKGLLCFLKERRNIINNKKNIDTTMKNLNQIKN